MVNPFFLGQSVLIGSYFNIQRLLVVALSFFVSLFFGWLFYVIFAKLTLFGVDLDDVNKSPTAVGIYLFGYEVFLGLIVYGSLMIPLG
jgi:succinate-acetate transporter protein